jgi:hypothetical protein
MTNRELLAADHQKLSAVERQRQYLLREALTAQPCPACGQPLSLVEALGIDVDDYDCGREDCPLTCPCGARLEQVVPLWGAGGCPWRWQLKSEWLRERLDKALRYDRERGTGP